MELDEEQGLLNIGKSQLTVSVVDITPSSSQPSPLSVSLFEASSETGNAAISCCLNPRPLLHFDSTQKWGRAAQYAMRENRKIAGKATCQGKVYNFLERPDNWKCFVYHFFV
ncbi:hypothetical protein WA026_019236 [Henosepilachna vigintioctopunctata]|uniref:Uncharacterized protein n=1 Tax=Henosepilachna vigintioctopunctata TaxID=420089 RepID=A0AAW1V525_9CUCU